MCGRFSLGTSKEKILGEYPKLQINIEYNENYNIAPTQHAYLITNDRPTELQAYRWGLVPYWAKNDRAGYNMINARREGIFTKSSFRIPIRKRRCLILADGFYEWKKRGTSKIPYRMIAKDGHLLAMAGIWDFWQQPDGGVLHSFSVITTLPNKEMEDVHDRMPVLLQSKEAKTKWLTDVDSDTLFSLMVPAKNDSLEVYPVSPKVNSVKSNSVDLYNRYEAPPTLF